MAPADNALAPCVPVDRIVMGLLENNVYLIRVRKSSDGSKAVMVVDPTCDAAGILDTVRRKFGDAATVAAIVLTHHHSDHMGAAYDLREMTGAPVIASRVEQPLVEEPVKVGTAPLPLPHSCPVDKPVEDGQTIAIGDVSWEVILTPGHSKGSMCLLTRPAGGGSEGVCPVLVSGDTLFAGAIGRTDFMGGSMDDMRASLRKLQKLSDDTIVLPGHGSLTTIAAERDRVFAVHIR